MRTLIKITLLLTLALTLVSCAKGKEAEIASPNTLTIGLGADAKRLIPMLATDGASAEISGMIFPGLTKFDKDIKIVGDLAESWDVSPVGMVITFHLRKGVKWHDGAPFTSADVLFTYKTIKDPKVATPYSDSLGPIKTVEAPDDYTVKVTYKEPFAPALEAWGMGIIPKHCLEGKDINTDDFNRHPIGTGMYKFEQWVTGQKIVLTANDEYYEGRPHIDKYIARIITDTATMFLELKARGIDYMGLEPLQYARQTDTGDFKKYFNKLRYPAFAYMYLGFNLKDSRFADKRVRQAISYAIDQKSIIEGALLGLGTPCTGPFPPESWAYNKDVKGYQYDPERAKTLLAEAGWKDTNGDGILEKDGTPFKFTILIAQGHEDRKKSAEIIQQELKKVGIDIRIDILEWQTYLHEYVLKGNFEATILGWNLSRDPDLYDIWYSKKTGPEQFNFIKYSNPEVDRLLIEGRQTFDMGKRKAIYYQIHQILSDDAACVFLYVPDALPILHKRFHGVQKAPLGIWYNLKDWSVPKDKNEWYQ
jgi:peptide/nickel transport system substrate-binding protein